MVRKIALVLALVLVSSLATAASPVYNPSFGKDSATFGWYEAGARWLGLTVDANGYLSVSIPGGIGTVSVTMAPLQPASTTVRTLTANSELVMTNITGQTLISLQNQGTGDVWFRLNASATVSAGYQLSAGSAVEIRMLSTDVVSVISSTTPTLVSVKQ